MRTQRYFRARPNGDFKIKMRTLNCILVERERERERVKLFSQEQGERIKSV